MSIIIGGVQKSSLLDFPDKISAIVFTQGCNFRCGYCHNPKLLKPCENLVWTEKSFFDFLKSRHGKLDGVVITGGEPCIQKDLKLFVRKIKELGFEVKLDTNGTLPQVIEELLYENLLDYIAMDIKAPLEKYKDITNTYIKPSVIKKSIDIIMNSGIDYEFRTTVLKNQLSYDDFGKISALIKGAERYYLQRFAASEIWDKSLMCEKTYTDEEFKKIIELLSLNINFVELRT